MFLSSVGCLTHHLFVISTPTVWPNWPFLPVIRRSPGSAEFGVIFDACSAIELTGYRATILLTNMFLLPPTLAAFLALPKEVYDTAEELLAAGWRGD